MRNFGATAPPLAPEPSSDKVDSKTGKSTVTTGSSSHGAEKKTTIKGSDWPGGESPGANVPPATTNSDFGAKGTPGAFQTGAFGDSNTNLQPVDVTIGTKRLAKELDEFVAKGSARPAFAVDQGDAVHPSEDAIADLQLQTARKLRQLLPTNRELLNFVQERNWIPLLLGWLNLHDRPAVQVEALLALTNIAELCAHHSYYQHAQAQSSAAVAAAAAAQAAAAAAKAGGTNLPASSPLSPFYSYPPPPTIGDGKSASSSSTTATYPYPSLLTPPQGQVPFPPLSFSQKMTPEALAALDASLTNTIQQTKPASGDSLPSKATSKTSSPSKASQTKGSSGSSSLPPFSSLSSTFPPASLSPASGSSQPLSSFLSPTSTITAAASTTGSPFLPPPTPVASYGGGNSFPQQLSASSQHLLLRHADAIPTLISLLASPNREVYEQAMWILGSIAAGDSPGPSSHSSSSSGNGSGDGGRDKSVAARDVILAAGIMNQMLSCLEAHPQNLSLQRIGSWTLSNLVEGLFQQSSHGKSRNNDYSSCDEIDTTTLLPVLRRLLNVADAEVLSYTCWTLSHLCDGPSSHISAVVTTRDKKGARGGLVPRLVELLIHPSWRVTKPALRTIGNIVCAECSDDNNHGSSTSSCPTDYTEIILDCGAVPRLKELVLHNNREIQKEACWTLSNIAAGTVDQIQAVIDSGAIPHLVKLVGNKSTDQEVRSEACWVVLNATSCGSDSQIEVLVEEGCVSVLGVLLGEASMVMMALEGLERVLQVEETREASRREQIENGEIGEDEDDNPSLVKASLIERALEKHNSSAVTKRANRIWKQHFVSCALCNQSFSKHRTSDATFCEECKCYVCSCCDCKIYHLSYQEELWAVNEEETEAKKSAKKSKKQKKKEKQKQKKAKQQVQPQATPSPTDKQPAVTKDGKTMRSKSTTAGSASELEPGVSTPSTPEKDTTAKDVSVQSLPVTLKNEKGHISTNSRKDKKKNHSTKGPSKSNAEGKKSGPQSVAKVSPSDSNDADINDNEGTAAKIDSSRAERERGRQPSVDFVLYLQETGSIIALAKLMDTLYGDGSDYEPDEADAQLMNHRQQMLNQQATT